MKENSNYKQPKWWNHPTFPLVPLFKYRPADYHNTAGWCFTWLGIKLWTLDAANFELAVVLDDHWGLGVTAIVPYLRIAITIPMPMKMAMWLQKNLWRKSQIELDNQN